MKRIKITHIITGLNTGGAETMLYKLISSMERDLFSPEVISLTDAGPVGDKIQSLDVPVEALGMKRGAPDPRAVFRLACRLRQRRPDLLQTWMYHADLIGGMAAKIAGDIPLAWGIRHSNLDPEGSKRTTIWTAQICARLSGWLPKRIVCCSEASKRVHALLGYDTAKMVVIPNGFDLASFLPDSGARHSVRQELGISPETIIIGLVGRFDPQKDHYNFIRAAALLNQANPDVAYLLCGEGITWDNKALAGWIEEAGLRERFYLLGRRDDMPRIQASLDIAVSSSSYGEGFSNTVGEAMACGVPCVVTDVGDSAIIVGDTGRVVQPKDPAALAGAWGELIRMTPEARAGLGAASRNRIMENFSLPVIAARYEQLYRELMPGPFTCS
jgi:glycosyltransferase involved in cell wall biosynthesis